MVIHRLAGYEHIVELCSGDIHYYGCISERIQTQHIVYGKVSCRMVLKSHSSGVAVGYVRSAEVFQRVAHHYSEFLVTGERSLSLCQHSLELRIVAEEIHKAFCGNVGLRVILDVDVGCALAGNLSVFNDKDSVGELLELVLVLGDQESVMYFSSVDLSVGVSSDYKVEFREFLGNFHILVITYVREQYEYVALVP